MVGDDLQGLRSDRACAAQDHHVTHGAKCGRSHSAAQPAASHQFSTRSTRTVFHLLGPGSSIWNQGRPGIPHMSASDRRSDTPHDVDGGAEALVLVSALRQRSAPR